MKFSKRLSTFVNYWFIPMREQLNINEQAG